MTYQLPWLRHCPLPSPFRLSVIFKENYVQAKKSPFEVIFILNLAPPPQTTSPTCQEGRSGIVAFNAVNSIKFCQNLTSHVYKQMFFSPLRLHKLGQPRHAWAYSSYHVAANHTTRCHRRQPITARDKSQLACACLSMGDY